MKVVVRFDGKAFVPQSPVDIPVGTRAEIEVPGEDGLAAWIAHIESRGPLPYVDLENLDRSDLYP